MGKNRRCKYCGCIIVGSPKNCPECGKKIKRSGFAKALLILLVLFVVLLIIPTKSTPSTSTNSSQSQTSTLQNQEIQVATKASTYEKEITFQDFSWGESATSVSQKTGEQIYVYTTPTWEDADSIMPLSSYQLGYRIYTYGNRQIAGYNVGNFSMYFMYGQPNGQLSTREEDSKLYLVSMNLDVADVEGTYDDLYQKLTGLYGEGKTSTRTGSTYSLGDGAYKSDISVTEWEGANNTGVLLAKRVPREGAPDSADAFSRYVVLSYGKTDSSSTISDLYKQYRQYVANVENGNRDSNNTNGL